MHLANQHCNCGYQLHQCNNSPSVLPMSAAGWGQVVWTMMNPHKWSDDSWLPLLSVVRELGVTIIDAVWLGLCQPTSIRVLPDALCGPYRNFAFGAGSRLDCCNGRLCGVADSQLRCLQLVQNAWFALTASTPTHRIQLYKLLHGRPITLCIL